MKRKLLMKNFWPEEALSKILSIAKHPKEGIDLLHHKSIPLLNPLEKQKIKALSKEIKPQRSEKVVIKVCK